MLSVGRLNLNVQIGCIGRYRRIGRKRPRGARLSRESRSSTVFTDDNSAKGVSLAIHANLITVLRRPFVFLLLSLKNVGGVFQTSSVIINLLNIISVYSVFQYIAS